MYHFARPDLRAVLLGEYDFVGQPVVHGESHQDPTEIRLTAAHEAEHRRMVGATSFGLLQQAAAIMTAEFAEAEKPDERAACETTLMRLIEESWFCHEGAATVKEWFECPDVAKQAYKNSMPLNYRKALDQALAAAQFISADSLPILPILSVTLLECAMNTRILERVRTEDILAPDKFTFLAETAENPDQRVELITEAFAEPSTGRSIEQAIRDRLFALFHAYSQKRPKSA